MMKNNKKGQIVSYTRQRNLAIFLLITPSEGRIIEIYSWVSDHLYRLVRGIEKN